MSSTPLGGSTAIRSPLLRPLPPAPSPSGGLVDRLLREQQSLTAVERFSRQHDEGALPAQSRYYRHLIPLARPAEGQQYAFEVDLDSCTGCKACVAACHSLNGLEETEIWRTVGLLHGGDAHAPAQRTVTTSCHHCVDPACLNGCPVQAYEKDPVTGIVRHLDDQCIGCQYCTLMCPYDAPKYSKNLGIVRKCDMCSGRLAVGEAPACVQGCPNEAIKIRIVDKQQAIEASEAGTFLPGAPTPEHTIPTTVYKGSRAAPSNLLPADFYGLSPENSHPPLVLLLVLTQLAAGAFAVTALVRWLFSLPATGDTALAHAGFALALGFAALGASVFHLGRPQGAWRAFLGLRTSWMSREALAFAMFAKAGAVYAASLAAARWPGMPGAQVLAAASGALQVATVAFGLLGVACSVMIYVATRRVQWTLAPVGAKFAGTTVLLGAATVLLVSEVAGRWFPEGTGVHGSSGLRTFLLWTVLGASIAKLGLELSVFRHLRDQRHTVLKRVALLMKRDLALVTRGRFLLGVWGGVLLPVGWLSGWFSGFSVALLIFVFSLLGELGERFLFFAAAPPSRMPGSLS